MTTPGFMQVTMQPAQNLPPLLFAGGRNGGRFFGIPDLECVGRALGADIVIGQNFVGGGSHFGARKHQVLSAMTGKLDGNILIPGVAQNFDQMVEVFDRDAIDRFHHLCDRA